MHQIMDEAESFRDEFYTKRKIHCETNKNNNREKEKVIYIKVIYMYILRKSILFYIFLYLLRCDDEQEDSSLSEFLTSILAVDSHGI